MGAATIMTRIVMPGMESRNRGAIINLASSAALSPQPLVSAYTASKVRPVDLKFLPKLIFHIL